MEWDMSLSRQEIYFNYRECLRTVSEILTKRYSWNDRFDLSLEDMAQTVTGDAEIVALLQSAPFDARTITPVLTGRIEALRKELIPDLKKKQFFPLFDYSETIPVSYEGEISDEHASQSLHALRESLSEEASRVLNRLLGQNRRMVRLWMTQMDSIEHIETKLIQVHDFFPDLIIPDITTYRMDGPLEDKFIIDCYKCVYLGIEPQFPAQFLKHEGDRRAAVLTRYFVEHIVKEDPQHLLQAASIHLFSEHNLQNVVRYFNYSLNRILANAYPGLILPWFNSRIPDKFWENVENRTEAVRWLVEQHLNMDPERIDAQKINRRHFTRNGLSFLYNTYYNSISRALQEAYPFLHRWECGSVPFRFWTDQTAGTAIRWMVAKKGWAASELPELIRSGKLTRKTFSAFGLATLFDKKFNKNLYLALNCAYPERFMPWELGKVPSVYWKKPENIFRAAQWIAKKEGIARDEVLQAIRTRKISLYTLKKYSIGTALKHHTQGSLTNLYWPEFHEERMLRNEEVKLIRKLNLLIESHTSRNRLLHFILHGFYSGLHRHLAGSQISRFKRMRERIRKRRRQYDIEKNGM